MTTKPPPTKPQPWLGPDQASEANPIVPLPPAPSGAPRAGKSGEPLRKGRTRDRGRAQPPISAPRTPR